MAIRVVTRAAALAFRAEQFDPEMPRAAWPQSVFIHGGEYYQASPQLNRPIEPGDWVLCHAKHGCIVIDSVLFDLLFEPVKDDDD